MAYMALYRKWRPTQFDDVRGQDAIVRTLKNQLTHDRLSHAYLFCGTRGTGKTSVAKILARAVNCENPKDGNPCNECASCRAILSGNSMSVMEIDAASNNSVDNVREIRDQVQYAPAGGRYQVYIIDEVHMLSASAFNALLKTLEEPPSYVLFILATTEPNRIPVTVLSRCQRYDFKHIGGEVIADRLNQMLAEEKIEAEPEAVSYIARVADGSMRDAISLLEQCISFYFGQKLHYEDVLDVLGAVDTEVFSRLLREVVSGSVPGCVALLDEIIAQGRELVQFVTDFIWYLRNLLLVQTTEISAQAMDMSAQSLERLKEESSMVDLPELMRYIRIFSELSGQIRYASSGRVLVELALIRMMQPATENDPATLAIRLSAVEEKLESGSFTAAAPKTGAEGQPAGLRQDAPDEIPGPEVELSEADYNDYEQLKKDWNEIVAAIKRPEHGFLAGTQISGGAGGVTIVFRNRMNYQQILQKIAPTGEGSTRTRLDMIREHISAHYGREFRLNAQLLAGGEGIPRVTRGRRIEGIAMDIEDGD